MKKKLRSSLSLLLSFMMVVSVFATVPFSVSAADETLIGTVEEWDAFAQSVADGNDYNGKTVKLTSDLKTVTTMVGGTFSGTFDGDNHMITADISGATVALFSRVKNATLKNFTLSGRISGTANHTAALVAGVDNNTNCYCDISNVIVTASVVCSSSHFGGFIGHGGGYAGYAGCDIRIENSQFLGKLVKTGSEGNYTGVFVGWSNYRARVTVNNSVFGGHYSNTRNFNVIGFCYYGHSTVKVSNVSSNSPNVHNSISGNDGYLYSGTYAAIPKIEASATGYLGVYDGEEHSISVTVSSPGDGTTTALGDTDVSYGLDGETFPKNVGDYTVYYQVTKPGYETAEGSATVSIIKKLISNCSLTLDGDIIINFNIDPSAVGLTPENIGSGKELTVTFEWAKDFSNASDKPKTDISKYSKTITVDSSNVGSKIPVSCPVCAAEMSCQVRATATLNGVEDTKDYSVRDYADSVINPREDSSFANLRDNNPTAYAKLVNLVSAMVDYGAKAQKVFNINTSDLANKNLTGYEMEDVTDDMFVTAVKNANNGASASNMKDVAAQLGANYYTTSLIFLDQSTLRHYFTKKDSSFEPSLYDGNQADTYYFKVKENIPAHQLDKLQEFTVGSTTFYYSALDYAKVLNASSAATADMKDLAKSLYWYSQAANGYIS